MNGEVLIFPDAGVNKDVSLAASRCQTGSHWTWRVLLSVPCVDTQRKPKKEFAVRAIKMANKKKAQEKPRAGVTNWCVSLDQINRFLSCPKDPSSLAVTRILFGE
jgi:hypothetical protein